MDSTNSLKPVIRCLVWIWQRKNQESRKSSSKRKTRRYSNYEM